MTQFDFKGKTAVIAGGAKGIGYATSKILLNNGASCIIWDYDEKEGQKASKELLQFGNVIFQHVDVRDYESIKSNQEILKEKYGEIHILVYCCGVLGTKNQLWKCSVSDWRNVIENNLIGCFQVCHALVPLLLKANFGRIVTVSSVSGKDGSIYASHYSSSKAGIIALTKSLAKELAPYNILVNCVTPSATKTPFLASEPKEDVDRQIEKIYLKRPAEPEEIAHVIEFLCSENCSFSTGAIFDASGGRSTY